MRKLVSLIIGLFAVSIAYAQDYAKCSDYGFRLSTNVTALSYSWTNDHDYPFRLGSVTLNSGSIVTTVVSLVRPHSITRQLVGDVVTTNDMGCIETNYYYIVTNTVTTFTTNALLSVTNTASIYDEDDLPKVYLQRGDILNFNFGATNTISILIDALR
jgi:hypothetical protein